MPKFDPMRYDRTVSDEFLRHFLPEGFAASLLQYANARYPIDLQLRANPAGPGQVATLYLGMTAVLNVVDKGKQGISLKAHKTYTTKENGWREEWAQPAGVETWRDRWSAVENYLERVIPVVMANRRFTATEGLVQAAVSVYSGDSTRAMLDREVVPSFVDTPTKEKILASFSDPLVRVVNAVDHSRVPGKRPPKFGAQCDALALRSDGSLMAVEVKPGSVGSLAWVPAQATMYSRVLQHWIDNDPEWENIIRRTFAQRHELGLTPSGFTMPKKLEPHVVPAVAFQRIASTTYIDRMFEVHHALQASEVGHPDIQFFEVSLSGRLDERKP